MLTYKSSMNFKVLSTKWLRERKKCERIIKRQLQNCDWNEFSLVKKQQEKSYESHKKCWDEHKKYIVRQN